MIFQDYFLSLLVGVGVGILTAWLKLPIPAPLQFAGVITILGIYLGYSVINGDFS